MSKTLKRIETLHAHFDEISSIRNELAAFAYRGFIFASTGEEVHIQFKDLPEQDKKNWLGAADTILGNLTEILG
jgi:hypothetical protein